MDNQLKILIIGPSQAGKTAISNYLSGRSDSVTASYRPTVGCRIVDIERDIGMNSYNIQLWDVSGNQAYAKTWPAILHGANGIILVYNADVQKDIDELKGWIKNFHEALQIPTTQCAAFGHHPNGKLKKSEQRKIICLHLNFF